MALLSFNFPAKYFIFSMNKGANTVFAIAKNDKTVGLDTVTGFMSYDKMNAYLIGYNKALKNPLK